MPERPVPIPKDKATRDRLAKMAGLTDEERKALDAWCYEQAEEDRRRQRHGLEKHGDGVMGTVPERRDDMSQIPEARAAERAGRLLRQFVAAPYLSDQFWDEVGGKAMASFGQLSTIHAEMKADPNAIRERDVVLRQQSTARLDQYDWHLEQAAEAKQAWVDHCAAAERIRAQRLAEFDADDAGVRDDERREREARQDEAGAQNAPRIAS